MEPPALVLLLDYPEGDWLPAGLRRDVGDGFAARIVRLTAELQLANAPQNWPTEVHVAAGEWVAEVRRWLGAKPITVHAQLAAPWGERLAQVAAEATARHDGMVILLRSDCPYCGVAQIVAAAKALLTYDVVLGPATDGDFYLLGLRRWPEGLLHEVNWGTNQVLFALTKRCTDLGLSYHLLDPLERVVDGPSWDRAVARISGKTSAGE
ncbi:MAG TPA: DUF2064 domain-containing protein [Opitutaceae bacterium]|nr:DUF2064 domain-containing protein [Opitutaceae bacterium]